MDQAIYSKLLLVFLFAGSLNASGFKEVRAFVPGSKAKLYYNGKDFAAKKDNTFKKIERYDLPKQLQDITPSQFAILQKVGYVSLHELSNGDFALKSHLRLKGGGPIFGAAVYTLTKAMCYGAAMAGIGAATAAVAPIAAPIMGAAAVVATTTASAGAGAVAGVMGTSIIASEVGALGATLVITQAGSVAAAAGVVETLAMGLSYLATIAPTP